MEKKKSKKNIQTKSNQKLIKETDNNKKYIIAFLLLVILVCTFFSIKLIINSGKSGNTSDGNDSDVVNKEVLEDKKVDDLMVTNARVIVRDDSSTFMAVVKNETDSDYHLNVLYVTFTTGNMTRKRPVLMDATINAHDQRTITLILDSDISDTTKIDYEVE